MALSRASTASLIVTSWAERSAVRLPGREPLVLCEGVETALSIWQATGQEVWACLGISNIARAPVPDKATAIIARDGDAPGSKAEGMIILKWPGVAFAPIENPYREAHRLSPCRGRFERVEEIAGEYARVVRHAI